MVLESPCTVHQDAKNKSLGEQGKPGLIVGKSEETKGYRVYIAKDKLVIVTHNIRKWKPSRMSRINNCGEYSLLRRSRNKRVKVTRSHARVGEYNGHATSIVHDGKPKSRNEEQSLRPRKERRNSRATR